MMTNNKSTKKALISSILSLVICLTMLIGTTFAWFTDSVTSSGNKIQSGTLKLDLQEWDAETATWNSVDGEPIFDYDLWEPGYTDVHTLQLVNLGTLDLKWQADIVATGEVSKLAEVIDVYAFTPDDSGFAALMHWVSIYDGSTTSFVEDDWAAYHVGTLAELIADAEGDGLTTGVMTEEGQTDVMCIALHMQEGAGNEYQGLSIGEGFDLVVRATQLNSEEDSFGPDYDKDAEYLPFANVSKLDESVTVNVDVAGVGTAVTLDTAYNFAATETPEEADASYYKYWHADFVVSADQDIPANSIVLAGWYELWCNQYNNGDWLGFANPEAVAAGDEIRLLDSAQTGSAQKLYINYSELCDLVKEFKCGAADIAGLNEGTTITVELRLYETEAASASNGNSVNVETGNYEVIGTYTYTFEPSSVPEAGVTAIEEDVTVNVDAAGVGTEVTLDTAYNFAATETADEVENSAYRYWHADFVVSFDKDIAAESIVLAGAYDAYENGKWIGFTNPEAVAAGDEIRLLDEAQTGSAEKRTINYEELCTLVKEFKCGAADLTDANEGTTITVELRLYETEEPSAENGNSKNVETGNYVVAGTYTYTF